MSTVIDFDRETKKRTNPSIDAITALTQDDILKVNQTIIERMESPVILIPQVAGHIIAAGGKRLRPMLTLASARMCGYQGNRHIGLAACIEFIHTATLLHDDVVDAKAICGVVRPVQTPFGVINLAYLLGTFCSAALLN